MKTRYQIDGFVDIAEVPASFPVGFCLLTQGNKQYAVYYDKDRQMTVAARDVDSRKWQYEVLPSTVGWDTHNYITIAADPDGYLHVSGNMHCDPLVYFRTETPNDITTFQRIPHMTGEEEKRCTYPRFLFDKDGRLIFHYRNGGAARGAEIYNVYDTHTRTWQRLLDQPLTDGGDVMNAYFHGPLRGPDGWFHLAWVWRSRGGPMHNHHLSYARSKDLIHWESVAGELCELPVTLENKSLWVDPIPEKGGIINGCLRLVFDHHNRLVIGYHKYDAEGNLQLYAARFENGEWGLHPLTSWTEHITWGGSGCLPYVGIRLGQWKRVAPRVLALPYRHQYRGNGNLLVDEETLTPSDRNIPVPADFPSDMETPESDWEGMGIRRAYDQAGTDEDSIRYLLQWETLPPNNDKPREEPLPEPSMLRVYKLSLQYGNS